MRLCYLRVFIFIAVVLFFQSCIPYERLVNFEKEGTGLPFNVPENIMNQEELTVQANDVLGIVVHWQDVETAAPFNLNTPTDLAQQNDPNLYQLQGYLVNQNGEIDLPILGRLNVKGMTKDEIKALLLSKLNKYLKEPVVNIRLLNFRVTVSGEVNRHGTFNIYNDRITVAEIMTMAGDLTPYADRAHILLTREKDGKRTYTKLDISSNQFFQSKNYYLRQNDFIYVRPIEEKRGAVVDNSNKTLPFITAFVSVAALLISIFN